jgi:hypothetical protein
MKISFISDADHQGGGFAADIYRGKRFFLTGFYLARNSFGFF